MRLVNEKGTSYHKKGTFHPFQKVRAGCVRHIQPLAPQFLHPCTRPFVRLVCLPLFLLTSFSPLYISPQLLFWLRTIFIFLKLINNSRKKLKKKLIFNQYLEIEGRSITAKFWQTLISIFSQNMNEFEKQVQTLGVHPLISEIQTSWLKKLGCTLYFQPACLYLEIRGRTLTRVWTIAYI